MPVRIFEGVRADELDDLNRRNMERRFYALAAAVKEHEINSRKLDGVARTEDERLYRNLRRLCGEPPTEEHGAA